MQSVSLRIVSGLLWLILSISLGSWWAINGFRQSESIALLKTSSGVSSNSEALEYIEKQHRMIRSEGIFFLILISGGGLAIIIMSVRDVKRNKMIKDFFATVTHEMKTPLASLRLQAESMEDLMKSPLEQKLLKRLISDTTRLELQMDKALYLASISRAEIMFVEAVSLFQILNHLKLDYENLIISGEDYSIMGDKRALESIFRNLTENAFHHGQATRLDIYIKPIENMVRISLEDNGIGFKGDTEKIGTLFHRHNSRSGSGVGLFLVKTLVSKMHGNVTFKSEPNRGFHVELTLPLAH